MHPPLLGTAIRRLTRAAAPAAALLAVGTSITPAHAEDDAPYPGTVEELVTELRTQQVIVQQTQGSGDAQGTVERLTTVADTLDFPVYVALVSPPVDMESGSDGSRLLATSLARRLGPGLYVVEAGATVTAVTAWDIGLDRTRFSLQVSTNADEVLAIAGGYTLESGVLAQTALLTATATGADDQDYDTTNLDPGQLQALADRQVALEPYTRPDYPDEADQSWTAGKRAMVGTVAGVGAFGLVWFTLRGWPGWRRRQVGSTQVAAPPTRHPIPALADLRRQAEQAATALATDLAAVSTPVRDIAALERANLARTALDPLLGSSEPDDLLGVVVLSRIGRDDVRRANGRAVRRPWRACFFSPLHPGATTRAQWRFGDADVAIPVCSQCQRALAGHGRPDVFTPPRLGPDVAYYRTDSVWARTGYGALVDDLAAAVVADPDWRRRR